jgi:hypothetical protein
LTANIIGNRIRREKANNNQINQMHRNANETSNDRKNINKDFIYEYDARNDHLKDGIGNFIYKKQFKYINPLKFVNKSDYNKIKYKNNDYNISQRVIIPDKNTLQSKPNRKKFFSMEKNLRHTSDGSYQSLIDRTPVYIPIKGKKKVNLSFDNSNGQNHDIFLIEKIKKRNEGRLFGVERKNIIKNHNTESTIPEYKVGKRHFFNKEVKTSLY